MAAFVTHRRVELSDTDLEGIVHFARYFVFLETAEHELLRSIGSSVHLERDGAVLGWPRVEVSCRYRRPARFGDELDLRLEIERLGTRSVIYRGTICRGEEVLAEGRSVAVCCRMDGPDGMEPVEIPADVAAALTRFVAAPKGPA